MPNRFEKPATRTGGAAVTVPPKTSPPSGRLNVPGQAGRPQTAAAPARDRRLDEDEHEAGYGHGV